MSASILWSQYYTYNVFFLVEGKPKSKLSGISVFHVRGRKACMAISSRILEGYLRSFLDVALPTLTPIQTLAKAMLRPERGVAARSEFRKIMCRPPHKRNIFRFIWCVLRFTICCHPRVRWGWARIDRSNPRYLVSAASTSLLTTLWTSRP